jgi:hypothetical protein
VRDAVVLIILAGHVHAHIQYSMAMRPLPALPGTASAATMPAAAPAIAAGSDVALAAEARWAVLGLVRAFITNDADVLLCTFAERPALKVRPAYAMLPL